MSTFQTGRVQRDVGASATPVSRFRWLTSRLSEESGKRDGGRLCSRAKDVLE